MTSTPHDKFFRSVFEQPEHAAAELRYILPERFVAAIRWSTLRLEPGSFIDPKLADQRSDLLFSAELDSGVPVLIFVVFEHQSTNDSVMALRLLGYMVRVWERWHRDHHDEPLPLILPAVLAQVPGGWKSPTKFSALFSSALGDLVTAVPDFAYTVDDLAHATDEDLRQRTLADATKIALWAMRDARDGAALLRSLEHWLDTLERIVRAPSGREAAIRLLRYIALVADELQFDQFRAKLTGLAPATETLAMTIAEQLRAEGEAKGRAEGRAEGRAGSIFLVLETRGFHLDESFRTRVTACIDAETLDQWLRRAVTVDRPDDLFER